MEINVNFPPIAVWLVFLACLPGSGAALSSEPCSIKYEGMINNATMKPNPPRILHGVTLSAGLYATRDMQIITVEGYIQDEELGFKYSFKELVCDISETFCPVAKGEIRELEYSGNLTSIWRTNAPLRVEVKLRDGKGHFVASASIKHCSIVKK